MVRSPLLILVSSPLSSSLPMVRSPLMTTAHKGEWEPAQTGKVWEQQKGRKTTAQKLLLTKILGATTAQGGKQIVP